MDEPYSYAEARKTLEWLVSARTMFIQFESNNLSRILLGSWPQLMSMVVRSLCTLQLDHCHSLSPIDGGRGLA